MADREQTQADRWCDRKLHAQCDCSEKCESPRTLQTFSESDAERMKWLAGILEVSPRSLTDAGARELASLCFRATRALGFAAANARAFPTAPVTPWPCCSGCWKDYPDAD